MKKPINTQDLRYFPKGISTNFSLAKYHKILPVTTMLHDAADEIDSLRDQIYHLLDAKTNS